MSQYWIAPSLLSADFFKLGEEINAALTAGADLLHIDVMDHHYVPNLTFGPLICESIRKNGIKAPLDVHLMVKPVDELIVKFAKAGATYITFHPEASEHIDRSIQLIKSFGCKAGLVLNPATPISCLDYTLNQLDMVVIMSVNPGFSGQTLIPKTLEKARKVRDIIRDSGLPIRLEMDGGLNPSNVIEAASAGVDTFVMGSAFFSASNYKNIINTVRGGLNDV